ncbi:hypothetical protein [Caballeronia sp. 15711]
MTTTTRAERAPHASRFTLQVEKTITFASHARRADYGPKRLDE